MKKVAKNAKIVKKSQKKQVKKSPKPEFGQQDGKLNETATSLRSSQKAKEPVKTAGAVRKVRLLSWDSFEKKMLGPGLKQFWDNLQNLEGKEYTAEYLKALQHFKPLLSRDIFIGDVPPINLKELPKEVLLALRDATSEHVRNKIIKKYYRERNKTAD